MSIVANKPPEQQTFDILRQLYIQLDHGWRSFLVNRFVHSALDNGSVDRMMRLFETIEYSSLDSVYLVLSKLLVTSKDAITIPYLLNYIESNQPAFRDASSRQVTEAIKEHRDKLHSIHSIVSKIEERRDRTVAHLDKLHINNPTRIYIHDHFNEKEAREAFKLILEILNTYSGFLGYQEPFSHRENSAKLAENWDELESLINPISPSP